MTLAALFRLLKLLLRPSSVSELYSKSGMPSGRGFLNFGWWEEGCLSLEEACQELVRRVGQEARLSPRDRVLDVGFGLGEQDLLWTREFGVEHVLGLNVSFPQAREARRRSLKAGFSHIRHVIADAVRPPLGSGRFDKLLALECAFHFRTRRAFLTEARRLLAPGGRLVLTDIVRGDLRVGGFKGLRHQIFGRLQERHWHIPPVNAVGLEAYQRHLSQAGFQEIRIEDITEYVLLPYVTICSPGTDPSQSAFLDALGLRLPPGALAAFIRSGYFRYLMVSARR
ncbi:MAG TPA: class I SAM-dependent methyltransferase [Acidobacteriota bacterium]|nr:class I SAM-dependent methyltransferase [Acidobacteriota bacterium]